MKDWFKGKGRMCWFLILLMRRVLVPETVATIVALKMRDGDNDGAAAVLDSAIKCTDALVGLVNTLARINVEKAETSEKQQKPWNELFFFSSLLASLVTIPFAMFATPGLDNVFLRVVSGLRLGLWFLGDWLTFFLPQVVSLLPLLHLSFGHFHSFMILRWHGRLVCASLVCEVVLTS
ncbi:hypothetical protein YC2023_016068 [Brassica napus]